MKKILLSIFTLSLLLISCNFTVEDTSLLNKPDIEETSAGIGVRIPVLNATTQYINLYRRDVTDTNTGTNAKIISLGILFPQVIGNQTSSYFFEDINIYKTHKYQYYVRYTDNDGISYTSAWSDVAKAKSGFDSEIPLTYNTSTVKFSFNEKNQTLKIHGTILPPGIPDFNENYVPVISVKSDTASEVFELGELSEDEPINLRGILSSDFMDKEITIIGILGQKKEYIDTTNTVQAKTKQVKRIIWTEPAEMNITGHKDGKITIKSDSGTNGYDYS